MPRPKPKDARVQIRFEEMAGRLAGIDEGSRVLIEDMVSTYAWYAVTVDDLIAQIDKEGVLVDGKENPACAVLHKMSGRKHEYFAKIQTATRKAQGEQEDALMDFIA